VRRGTPQSEEAESLLKTTIDGIEVFYSPQLQAADQEKGLTIEFKKSLFSKGLILTGAKKES
jgi:hypothetical protein